MFEGKFILKKIAVFELKVEKQLLNHHMKLKTTAHSILIILLLFNFKNSICYHSDRFKKKLR